MKQCYCMFKHKGNFTYNVLIIGNMAAPKKNTLW